MHGVINGLAYELWGYRYVKLKTNLNYFVLKKYTS